MNDNIGRWITLQVLYVSECHWICVFSSSGIRFSLPICHRQEHRATSFALHVWFCPRSGKLVHPITLIHVVYSKIINIRFIIFIHAYFMVRFHNCFKLLELLTSSLLGVVKSGLLSMILSPLIERKKSFDGGDDFVLAWWRLL